MLVGWVALIVVARLWGDWLTDQGQRILLDAAPLVGHDEWRITRRALGILVVAVPVVTFGPSLAARIPWKRLLAVTAVTVVAWSLALALVEGWSGVTNPVTTRTQYIHDVDDVAAAGVGPFVSGFTDRIDDYEAHVRAHPPGMVLTLWALDEVGLGGAGWTAALVIAGGAAAAVAVLIGVREVAGGEQARRAAPFVALAPAAMWFASTYDAFFAGVGAGAVALVVLATGRSGRRADLLAVGGGLLLGGTLMLSYGLVLLTLPILGVAWWRRSFRVVIFAGLGAAAVLGAFWLAGFSWLEGLAATRREYGESVAATRPYAFFFVSNLAALAVALGLAVVVALTRLRHRPLWWLVGGALTAVLLANVSGLSKGEVERIWLPFTVWLLPAAAALVASSPAAGRLAEWRSRAGPWLALQAGFAGTLQLGVHTVW